MEIGKKIRSARVKAHMTQEKAAEQIGVSRQTLSNWENEKTYPDIVSVVKMSDLYGISLDLLLKEPQSAENEYLSYLAESADQNRSRDRRLIWSVILFYLAFWSAALMYFWLLLEQDGALFYGILFQIILFPLITFVLSMILGTNFKWSWVSALPFSVLYVAADFCAFPLANMLSGGETSLPNWQLLFPILGVSMMGWGFGRLIHFLHHKMKSQAK